jgi:hypothetical protein
MHQKQPVGRRRCSTAQKISLEDVSFRVAGQRSSTVLSREYRTARKNRRLHPLGHRRLGVRVAPALVQQREKHDEAQPRRGADTHTHFWVRTIYFLPLRAKPRNLAGDRSTGAPSQEFLAEVFYGYKLNCRLAKSNCHILKQFCCNFC